MGGCVTSENRGVVVCGQNGRDGVWQNGGCGIGQNGGCGMYGKCGVVAYAGIKRVRDF